MRSAGSPTVATNLPKQASFNVLAQSFRSPLYPVLAYYRSQHEQQSWVKALTVNLDTCVLFLTCREDAP